MQRFVKKKKRNQRILCLTKVFIMQFRELIMRLSYENMNELLKLCKVKSFVCFKGRYQGFPGSPLCLTDVSVFAEIPKVVNSLRIITVVWEPGK